MLHLICCRGKRIRSFQREVLDMSPTWHLFLHLCEWAIPDTGLNPRSYWTYADEDIVGNLIEVAEGCHPATMAVVALTKWVLLAFE